MGADRPFPDWEQAAEQRDQDAAARDDLAGAHDHAAGGRDHLASDRELDASDRQAAAEDRAAAARDRAAAAGDERAAAADRAAAAQDRETARGHRVAAGQDRSGAAADREQTAVERAQHGYVPRPGGPSSRSGQALHGRIQETAGAAADLVERFIQAKRRELAAHLASVQMHEQMASLQEGLGHPDRAAGARARAERAREFHRVAGEELAEYLARIKAVEDRRASRRRDGTGRTAG